MKEMVYEYERGQPTFILDKGEVYGYEYLIISLGRHPCGYVCLTEDNIFYGKHYNEIPIECHGGLTFSEDHITFLDYSEKYKCMTKQSVRDKWVIGWDYAHYGDYSIWDGYGKKWRTSEIKQEILKVIKQLIYQDSTQTFKEIKERWEE